MGVFAALLAAAILAAPGAAPATATVQAGVETALKSTAIRMSDLSDVGGILPELAQKRVVFVGETHDRYEHHLNQLAIIQGLHQRHPQLAIGLEFFQWPFQAVLDRFVAGEIDETQMLLETEYFSRWRYDYRLYKPILDYARANNIPLLALNVPRELTEKVAQGGLAALSEEERRRLPADFDRDDAAYRSRIETVYEAHPQRPGSSFENFLDAQLCWDEGMAERAAQFLRDNPEHNLVILAGTGHVIEGSGIPERLTRRLPVSTAIVLNLGEPRIAPAMGDFLLLPEPQELPAQGLLGVFLDTRDDGLYVEKLADDGTALEAGIKVKDQLLAINGETLTSYAHLRVAMLHMLAGDQVSITVRRRHLLRGTEDITLDVTLR